MSRVAILPSNPISTAVTTSLNPPRTLPDVAFDAAAAARPLAAVIAGLFPVTILGELVSIGTLLADLSARTEQLRGYL